MLSLIPVKRELLHGRVEVQKDNKENKGEGTFTERKMKILRIRRTG